ncbi:hypothetical protein PMAC_000437 [Pneumocystis sp. 'macacae']|nr:hypothetical protein PMAC_000437 [Pneumocystis sp. 'macacae']
MPTASAQTTHKHRWDTSLMAFIDDEYPAPGAGRRAHERPENALEGSEDVLGATDDPLHVLDGAAGRYNPYKKVSGNRVDLGSFPEGRAVLYPPDDGLLKGAVSSENDTVRLDVGAKPPEVERRRRETINESISELARIVPGCEKNKGKILERAVSYIQQLKENEANNIEKWTLEKLLTDQAISELSLSNQKLKAECDRLWQEMNVWKQAASCGIKHPDEKKDDPISNVRAEKID